MTNTKKNHSLNPQGFTLIEIMIVVGIIGILATVLLVGLIIAKNKAKDAEFKSIISSVNASIMMCCFNEGVILTSAGGPVCSPPDAGSNYPDATKIGGIVVNTPANHNCAGANNTYEVIITPGTSNAGKCESAKVNQKGVVGFTGC